MIWKALLGWLATGFEHRGDVTSAVRLRSLPPMTRDEARAGYPAFDLHCRIVEQMDAEDPDRTLDVWERQRRYDEGLRK